MEALNNTPQIDVDELLNYDSVKSHLTLQIVSTEYTADKLVDVPHQEIQDMSIVYRIDLGETTRGCGISTLVANSLMKAFKVTTDQLHQDALENALKLHPLEITPLRSYLSQNFGFDDMMTVPPRCFGTADRIERGETFAYEQTEGEPLLQLGPDELTGDAKNYEAMKQAVISIAPVTVRFDEICQIQKIRYNESE